MKIAKAVVWLSSLIAVLALFAIWLTIVLFRNVSESVIPLATRARIAHA